MSNEKRGSQASSQAAQGSAEWQAGRSAQCTRQRPAHSTGDPVPAGGPRTRLGRRGGVRPVASAVIVALDWA